MRPAVGAIVLAAGQSSRMGANKIFLVLEGESLLRRMVGRALAAGLSPVVAVLGRDAERAREELASLPCLAVANPRYAEGMATSIHRGLESLPPETEAAAVLLVDQPLVTVEQLLELRAAYEASRPPLVVSEYGGVHAPPILYRQDLFPELLAVKGDGCRKRIIREHLGEAVVLRFPAASLVDIDCPEDYERVVRLLREGG